MKITAFMAALFVASGLAATVPAHVNDRAGYLEDANLVRRQVQGQEPVVIIPGETKL